MKRKDALESLLQRLQLVIAMKSGAGCVVQTLFSSVFATTLQGKSEKAMMVSSSQQKNAGVLEKILLFSERTVMAMMRQTTTATAPTWAATAPRRSIPKSSPSHAAVLFNSTMATRAACTRTRPWPQILCNLLGSEWCGGGSGGSGE